MVKSTFANDTCILSCMLTDTILKAHFTLFISETFKNKLIKSLQTTVLNLMFFFNFSKL